MTRPTLTEIIARLEKLTGPDRECDCLIEAVLKPDHYAQLGEIFTGPDISGRQKSWNVRGPHGHYFPPRYTASLDAALMLARTKTELLVMLNLAFKACDAGDEAPNVFPAIRAALIEALKSRAHGEDR